MTTLRALLADLVGADCRFCSSPCSNVPGLCKSCLSDLEWNITSCFYCGIPISSSSVCLSCASRPSPLIGTVSPLIYADQTARLIQSFKYGHQLALASTLGAIMRRRLPRFLRPTTVLLPVPSCPVRFRARGFNPAAEIAMSLADSVGVDCELSAVARRRGAVPQSSLKREAARRRNIHGAFKVQSCVPRDVVIVDDVMTSGATTRELSRQLMAAGSERINIWVCARAA